MSSRRGPLSVPRSRLLAFAHEQRDEHRALLLEVVTRIVHPSVLVVGLYFLFAGLHRPGGGFVAGLVMGAGLVLRRLAGGPQELGTAAPVPPGVLLGAGLIVVAGYGVAGLLVAGKFLGGSVLHLQLGALGVLEIASSLVFEVGIVLIVLGIVSDILRTLGAEDEQRPGGPPHDEGISV